MNHIYINAELAENSMEAYRRFWHDFRKTSLPRWKENRIILIYALVGGLILGYNDYNIYRTVLPPDIPRQIFALYLALVGAVIAVYLSMFVQKAYALRIGLPVRATFNAWKIAVGLFIMVFSYAQFSLPLIFPPDIIARTHAYRRLGAYPGGINYRDLANITFVAVLAHLLVAAILQIIFGMTSPFMNAIIAANAFAALALTVPIPGSQGFSLFYYSRQYWGFVLGFSLLGILLLYFSFATALLIAVACAVLLWFIVAYHFEGLFSD